MLVNERGTVTIMTALFISSVIAGLALVADVGLLYQEKRQLQTSVDAAALAGVMDLVEGKSRAEAEKVARAYLENNANVAPEQVDFSYPQADSFRVESRTRRDTFFGRILGIKSTAVSASATAQSGTAGSVNDLVPIIVPSNTISEHIGTTNPVSYELGNDRPLDPFSISYQQSGDLITYTIVYVNIANKPVDLEIWDPIPNGSTYVEGSATAGGLFDGTSVRWSFPQLAAGDSRTVSFKVAGANPSNTAYASAGGKTEMASTSNPQKGFFWLTDFNDGSGGVPDYRDWIVYGYPEEVSVGDLVNGEGVKASLRDALEMRLASKPDMILPVYDYTEGGGSPGTYHVIGFAQFIMTSFDLSGSPKTITGYFTTGTVAPGSGGDAPQDFGVKAIWLSN